MSEEQQNPNRSPEAQGATRVPTRETVAPEDVFHFTDAVMVGLTPREDGGHAYYRLEEEKRLPLEKHSGESMIYFCRRCEDESGAEPYGDRMIAKVYIRERLLAFIDSEAQARLRAFLHSDEAREHHVLTQIDHGYIHSAFYCEIFPYCEGGDLQGKRFSYEEIIGFVLPQLSAALYATHKAGFIHRDVKPANIYRSADKLCLADFGITTRIDVTHTLTTRGTPYYMSQEVRLGMVSDAADYYALGVTLLDLYKGSHIFADIQNHRVLQMVSKLELPLEFPPEHAPLRNLCMHLLLPIERRIGHDGVAAFLQDPAALDKPTASVTMSDLLYRFKGVDYKSRDDLCDAFLADWDEALKELMTGEFTRSFSHVHATDLAAEAESLVKDTDRRISVLPADDARERNTALLEDVALMRFLRKLSPSHWLCWRGRCYRGISELMDCVIQSDDDARPELLRLFTPEAAPFWLTSGARAGGGVEQLDDDVAQFVGKLIDSHPDWAVQVLTYRYATDEKHRVFSYGVNAANIRAYASMNELFEALAKSPLTFFRHTYPLLASHQFLTFYLAHALNDELLADMTALQPVAAEALDHRRTQWPAHDAVVLLMRMFESASEDKLTIRKFYLKYGDRADIVWIRNHLGFYVFQGFEAQALYKRFANFTVPNLTVAPVKDIIAALDEMMECRNAFQNQFADNYFLTSLNIDVGAKSGGIYSLYGQAYFVFDFWMRQAPAGLAYDIGAQAQI